MSGALKGLSLLIVGGALGLPLPGHAQTPAVSNSVTLTDVVGKWEYVPALSTRLPRDSSQIYRHIIVQSDTTILDHEIKTFRGDTVSCRGAWKADLKIISMSLGKGADGIQQLTMTWPAWQNESERRQVFKRADPAKQPFAHVIAAGFALGRAVPAHSKAPMGTLADVFGRWEGVPGEQGKQNGVIKDVEIFRPDSTQLTIWTGVNGKDTVTCGEERVIVWLQRIGDSIFTSDRSSAGQGYVLENQQLALYGWEKFLPDSALMRRHRDDRVTEDLSVLRSRVNTPLTIYQPVDVPKKRP